MSEHELLVAEQSRGEAFRLLSACFSIPARQAFLQEDVPQRLVAALGPLCAASTRHARRMQAALATTGDHELRSDYGRLFLGPFSLRAAPYGSAYLEPSNGCSECSSVSVLRWYERENAILSDHEMPDHIAVELEFLHHLTAQALAAMRQGNLTLARERLAKRREFLSTLVAPWIREFCRRIEEHGKTDWFRSLAACLGAFFETTERESGPPRRRVQPA